MQKIITKEESGENKEYLLELTFNSVVDTDIMETLQETFGFIGEMQENATSKNTKQTNNTMNNTVKVLSNIRKLLFTCLQEHNAEEIKNEKEAGLVIEKANKNGISLFEILEIISKTASECGFLAEMMGRVEEEVKKVPQDHKKKVAKIVAK